MGVVADAAAAGCYVYSRYNVDNLVLGGVCQTVSCRTPSVFSSIKKERTLRLPHNSQTLTLEIFRRPASLVTCLNYIWQTLSSKLAWLQLAVGWPAGSCNKPQGVLCTLPGPTQCWLNNIYDVGVTFELCLPGMWSFLEVQEAIQRGAVTAVRHVPTSALA